MTTLEPAKRKHHPGTVRRFQASLFIWTVLAFLACLYPLIWFSPPYEKLTPYIYFAASALWIPFGVRHLRRYGIPLRSIGLIAAGCGCTLLFLAYYLHPDNHPPQWFYPVHMLLYPWNYLLISLAWVPFVIRYVRQFKLPWLTMMLIIGAIFSIGLFVAGGCYVDYLIRDSQLNLVDAIMDSPIVQYRGFVSWHIIELTSLTGFPIAFMTKIEYWSCCSPF